MLEHLRKFGNKLRNPVGRVKGKTETPTLRNEEDIPFPSVTVPVAPEVIPQDILGRAILEYKKGPLTPELVNATWQTIWKTWGESINHTFQVPSCDRTSEELAELQKERKAVLLVPDELYTKEGLVLLGRMFPKMQNWSVSEGTTVVNEENKGGSIDIEMDIDSPNRNINERQAMDILKKEGRRGQRLATFIVGSQFSKLLTNLYLDEGDTWSRMLGSRCEGDVLDALFDSNGVLVVLSNLDRENHHPDVGFRSEGIKKAAENLPENQDPTKQFAIRQARELLVAAGVKDPRMEEVSSPVEQPTPIAPETPVEIKRFSEEQKEALRKEGYVIYGLTGQSIKTLRDSGRRFYPPSQKTTTLVVDECDSLLRRDVARWEFRRITPPKL